MRNNLARLEMTWEIPLALLSFLFYTVTRFCIHQIVQVQSLVDKKQAGQWRILCAQTLQSPFNLLALMTSAPRWNTHAIIALVGPLEVKHSLRLHVASAKPWTVVVHASSGHRIVASIGSSVSGQEPCQSVQLKPGRYRLVLRYYQWSEHVELPSVEVDGAEVVPATFVPANTNDFYHDLRKRRSWLYLCLHYYIGPLLRYRRWLPQPFIEREYLPAGNPQTEFYYGFLKQSESLAIDLDLHLLQTHDAYFTVYDRASFPVVWYDIREGQHITLPSPCDGSYLIRVHSKCPSCEPFIRDWVQIHVLSPYPVKGGRQDSTAHR